MFVNDISNSLFTSILVIMRITKTKLANDNTDISVTFKQ